jgi:hypothetical protein
MGSHSAVEEMRGEEDKVSRCSRHVEPTMSEPVNKYSEGRRRWRTWFVDYQCKLREKISVCVCVCVCVCVFLGPLVFMTVSLGVLGLGTDKIISVSLCHFLELFLLCFFHIFYL